MKRILKFFLVLVLLANTSKASHLFGGEITWTCQANGQYIFTLKLYRDCSGIPLSCGDATSLDVSGLPGLCSIPLSLACTNTDLSPIGGSPAAPCFTCASGDQRAVNEWKWVSNPITLNGVPPATGWTFSWNSCCRNTLANVGGGGGFTVRAKMYPYNGLNANPCYDSSPFFTERPNTLITTGFPYTYNPFAVDPEQDSLVYAFGNPLDQPSSTCPNFTAVNLPFNPPYSVNNPFPGAPALDPVTGELTLNNLNTIGNFAACIKVTAFKCGVKVAEIFRDYAIRFENTILICNPAGAINTPPDVFPPFASGFDTTVIAGDTVRFRLRGNDFEGTCPGGTPQSITIESPAGASTNWGTNYSDPNGGCLVPPCATLSKTLPNTALITNFVDFEWVTSCTHLNPPFYCAGSNNPDKNYTFILKMRDNVCPVPGVNFSTIKIKIDSPDTLLPPEIRCAKVDCGTGDVRLEWETPGGAAAKDTHNYFAKYHIFGSLTGAVGSFILIDSLEGGKPIFYNKFKDVSASKLSLLGAGVNGQTNSIYFQMKTVCGCDSTVFSKPSNIARSIKGTVSKTGVSVPLSWNAIHTPLLTSSSNKYEVWREYPVGTWTKVTDVIGATTYNDSTFVKGLCSDTITYQIRNSDLLACESRSNCFGFRFTQTITAGINPVTPVNLCAGATATLTATPATGGGAVYTYQWSGAGSGTNQSVTASVSGTYTVTVTQQPSGCTATASKVVNVSPAYNASVSGLTPKCAGQSTTLTITTGSTGNWQYWINGPAGQLTGTATSNPYNVTINNLQASHNYTLDSLKDINGCKATIGIGANIVVNPLPTAAIAVTTNDTICQGTNSTITFNFSGAAGQAPYMLTYTSPTGNQVINAAVNPYVLNVSPPPPSFTYGLVSLTDNNGCNALPAGLTGNRKIVVNPTPTATLSLVQGNDTICFGDSVRLKVDFTGTAPYNITLRDNTTGTLTPITTSSTSAFVWVKPNSTGNFNYTLQSFTSSTKLCTGPINNNGILIVVKAIPNANLSALSNTTICSGDSVNLSTAFTGAANYSFVWKPIGGSNTTVGNITATPYTYWVKPALGQTGYVLLSITDAFCSRSNINDTVFVNVNPLPSAAISTTTPSICQGTQATLSITFTGTANFSGSWQLQGAGAPTNFNTASNPYTFNLTPAIGTNIYELVGQVTDGNGCKKNVNAATATVNVIQLPVATLSGNDTACVGSAIQLNVNFPQGTAPYTFYYHNITSGTSGTATNVNPGAGNPYILNISGLAAGTYNFQLDSVKSSGCKGNVNGSATGVINPLPVAALTVASDTICQGSNTNLSINFSTGTGPYTYTLQGQAPATSAVNPITINVAPPSGLNTYTLVNIQDKYCPSPTNQAVTVRVIPNPSASITSTDSICKGDNANVTVTFAGQGPFSTTYNISSGGSNTITNNATTTYSTAVSPLVTTTYSLANATVTGLYGCSSVINSTATTVVSDKPTAVISGTQSICRNDSATISITFTGTAPYSGTYLVNGGGAVNFSGITSNPYVFKIKQTTAGLFNYTLSGLSDRYCSGSAANMSGTAAVTVKALPTAVLSGAATICNGVQTNLSIAFTGTGNFVGSYGPVGGPYTNYNTASNPLVIPVSPSLTTSYQLNGFVTDNTGCQSAVSTAPVAVNVTQLPQATISGSDTACAGQGTQLAINFPAGSAPYTFYYHNTTTGTAGAPVTTSANPYTLNVPSLAVGTYNFQLDSVTSFGCKGSVQGSGQVIVKPLPVANLTVASDTICEGTATTLSINFTTGTGPYTYQLSGQPVQNTSTNPTVISVSPTAPSNNYTLTNITDKFCSATVANQTVNVKVIPLPTANITSTPAICEQQTATVTVNFTGAAPFNATYTMKSPSTSLVTNNIVANASNTYTASNVLNETTTYTLVGTVSGLYGCSRTVADTHITIVHPKPVSQLLTVDDICVGQQTTLHVNFPVGTAPFNYTLQNNLTGGTNIYSTSTNTANINVSPALTTTYSIIAVTDANNCAASQMTNASTITVHALPQPVIVGDNTICDGQSSVLSTAAATPSYTNYVWSLSAATTPTITVNSTGSYSVTVTDVNGCVNTSPSFAFVVNDNPVVAFTNDTSLACEISNINFTNLSTYEPNAIFAWDLGDNATSSLVNPSHVYSAPGVYPITLTITNPTGCSSTLTQQVDITFFPLPEAKFTADPLATNIYSSGVNFLDQSANAVSWHWNFGDDNTSDQQHPSHYYGDVGEYMVKLVVTNIAGCVSEYQQEIIVNPFYLPNAFTPNKDGRNDYFFDPGFTLDVASYKMKIFNRWGQKFFESESTNKAWDGSDPSGAKAPQGVYVYSIDVKTKNGKSQQYNGTITLLR